MMCERISETLNLKFWAYDASKALFEDVIGFPNPESISHGTVEYTPTPISIWDKEFVLIDEISRATPVMQNKWLELIRSKRIMGKSLDNIKYVFAAMNPPDYPGAFTLDPALAGRFAWIIQMPEAVNMDFTNTRKVIDTVSRDDAPHIAKILTHGEPDVKPRLNLAKFLEKARENTVLVKNKLGERVSNYVLLLGVAFSIKGRNVDGRRLGMIRRNIITYLAVKLTKEEEWDVTDFRKVLDFSFPYNVTGESINVYDIEYAHHFALEGSGAPETAKIYSMMKGVSRIGEREHMSEDVITSTVRAFEEIPDDVRNNIFKELIEGIFSNDATESVKTSFILIDLLSILGDKIETLKPSLKGEVLGIMGRFCKIQADRDALKIFEELYEIPDNVKADNCFLISLRLASLHTKRMRRSGRRGISEFLGRIYKEVRNYAGGRI
jgi:hypothetical protein